MKAIQIKEPCAENWQGMSPTEQGAFCSKCSVDVIDFSRLSLDQVKLKLLETQGQHTCGRFDPRQLEQLNLEFDAWRSESGRTFQSKFIFALLLVFGLTLFSCSDEEASQLADFHSQNLTAALAEPEQRIADHLFFHQDAIIANEMLLPEPPSITECRTLIMGDYVVEEMIPPTLDTLEYETIYAVAGGLSYHSAYTDYLTQTVNPDTTTTLPDPIETVYKPFETKLYPNPASDQTSLSIWPGEDAQFKIELYAMNGQLLKTIHQGQLSRGQKQFTVDVSDLMRGTYLIRVWSEKQQETLKFIKL